MDSSVLPKVKALIDENNFPTKDIAYTSCWGTESGSMNPFYSEEFSSAWGSTQVNVCANLAIIGSMQIKNTSGDVVYTDPRLAAFFEKNADGKYVVFLVPIIQVPQALPSGAVLLRLQLLHSVCFLLLRPSSSSLSIMPVLTMRLMPRLITTRLSRPLLHLLV